MTERSSGTGTGAREAQKYAIPYFLLDPARLALAEPSLAEPSSQLCTAAQFADANYSRIASALTIDAATLHRKNWEWVYIVRVLEVAGMLREHRRGLGFGTGLEPITSLLAAHGADIVATDAPVDIGKDWTATQQHAKQLADLHKPAIVDRRRFDEHVQFQVADMRRIPATLRNFDFLWSSCALEHLGSLTAGIAFIHDALACLRPGGIAVHTTEFNVASNEATLETPGLSVYRKRDVDDLVATLRGEGHEVWPVNCFPGAAQIDELVDEAPYGLPHLKLRMADCTFTSMGIVVRRARA